jgi:NAD(P)-dependent dehydrogenase (short-subunit alcohol dehydrogenase family)
MMNLAGKTAVVTGAAGGIGRAISLSLARRGCHLALADVNEAGLAETAELAAGAGRRITWHQLDVADRQAVAAFPEVVTAAAHSGVDILVNNAGVAIGGTFEQVAEADFDWLIDINFWGVVRMTRAFLPLLKASEGAQLVNISSLFGLIAPPGQTAYCASKFAVRGFSESLRHELEETQIGVTTVHPGGVATSIAKNARPAKAQTEAELAEAQRRFERLLRMPPEQAGEIIVKAIEQRHPRVIVGSDAWNASLIERLFPVTYWRLLARV